MEGEALDLCAEEGIDPLFLTHTGIGRGKKITHSTRVWRRNLMRMGQGMDNKLEHVGHRMEKKLASVGQKNSRTRQGALD